MRTKSIGYPKQAEFYDSSFVRVVDPMDFFEHGQVEDL
jgi:hypothetical protein